MPQRKRRCQPKRFQGFSLWSVTSLALKNDLRMGCARLAAFSLKTASATWRRSGTPAPGPSLVWSRRQAWHTHRERWNLPWPFNWHVLSRWSVKRITTKCITSGRSCQLRAGMSMWDQVFWSHHLLPWMGFLLVWVLSSLGRKTHLKHSL